MKKNILTIFALLFTFSIAIAQTSIQLTNTSTGSSIANNSTILEDVAVGGQSHVYLQLQNTSSSSVTYAVKKTEVVINAGADAYFCWGGQCFPSTTTITPVANYKTLAAGEVYAPQSFYYDENVAAGYSEIKYEIYNINNINDAITFTFKFNPTLLAVKENSNLFSSFSDVYPNPSSSKAQIIVNSKINSSNVTVSITNALGSVVSIKNIQLNAGKNNIQLDSENLNSGIYFTTISSGTNKIVKKFTINK